MAFGNVNVPGSLSRKQDKLTGLPGQVVGFDGMGLAYAVRGWSNPNLLRNWYFADPINQRGQTEYTGNGYTIDGWGMAQGVSCKLIVSDGYVSVHIPIGATFYQHIENGAQLAGETVSLTFLCCNNELVTTTVQVPLEANSMTSKNVTIDNNPYKFVVKNASPDILIFIYETNNIDEDASIKPVAAKLELGPVQTLAHQDAAGNWVLNDPPPNKAAELAKCQRYYLPQLYATATYTKSTYWAIGAMFPVTMRTTPTFNKNVKFAYFGESPVSADVNYIIGDKYGVRYLGFTQSGEAIVDTSKRYGIELYDISAEL